MASFWNLFNGLVLEVIKDFEIFCGIGPNFVGVYSQHPFHSLNQNYLGLIEMIGLKLKSALASQINVDVCYYIKLLMTHNITLNINIQLCSY